MLDVLSALVKQFRRGSSRSAPAVWFRQFSYCLQEIFLFVSTDANYWVSSLSHRLCEARKLIGEAVFLFFFNTLVIRFQSPFAAGNNSFKMLFPSHSTFGPCQGQIIDVIYPSSCASTPGCPFWGNLPGNLSLRMHPFWCLNSLDQFMTLCGLECGAAAKWRDLPPCLATPSNTDASKYQWRLTNPPVYLMFHFSVIYRKKLSVFESPWAG